MGALVGIVAGLIALLGLLVALGHAGALAMLRSAAAKKGAAGEPTRHYVQTRWKSAAVPAGVALLGLLLTTGASVPMDVVGMLLSVGGGAVGLAGARREISGKPHVG
jgi:hypothetical protein